MARAGQLMSILTFDTCVEGWKDPGSVGMEAKGYEDLRGRTAPRNGRKLLKQRNILQVISHGSVVEIFRVDQSCLRAT